MTPSPAYLIPPVLCLSISLFLAGIALVRKPRTRERAMFALICLWWALLSPAFISHHLMDDPAAILKLERAIHFFYVFLPALHIVFSHQLLQLRRPALTASAFVASGLLAIMTPTEFYITGLNRYSWGYIARGGPVFQLFGIYAGLAIAYVVLLLVSRIRSEKNPVSIRKNAYLLLSFIVAGMLTLLNIPAINGYDLYPAGNFIFIPLSILAYGILRYRLLDIRAMMLQTVYGLGMSSLVLVPNVAFIVWLYRLTPVPNAVIYGLLLGLWFAANTLYLRHVQPAINRRFHRHRINLTHIGNAFLNNAAYLKNLFVLATDFVELMRRHLDISRVNIYLKKDKDEIYGDPLTGRRLDLPESLGDFLQRHPFAIGAQMAENHPEYTPVAKDLLTLMEAQQAAYLLPLHRSDRLVGLVMLAAPRHGRGLSPNELNFLDRMGDSGTAFSNSAMYQGIADLTASLEKRTGELTREIEERRRVEAELRQSEERHRLMAENLLDAIWVMDLNMKFTYVSPVVERLLGWSMEQFEQMNLDRVLVPEALELAMATLAEQLHLGEQTGNYRRSVTMALDHYHSSGDILPMEISASFLLDENGMPEGILGITRDIRERIRNEREREKLQERLARSRKMEALGLLAGGVAHDLNNILSGIVTYPELMLQDVSPYSDLVGPLKSIRQSGQRAAAVVSDLITIARGVASHRETTSLNSIIMNYLASSEYNELMRIHPNVELKHHLAPDLLAINCSAVHIQKVIMNLVANAVEAIEDEGTVIVDTQNRYVDIPLEESTLVDIGEYAVLQISDTGPGIAEEDIERIFEPFYTKKIMGRSGTGLGLSVVWNTVQDHDGRITVHSGGDGTCFSVYLPGTRELVSQPAEDAPMASLTGNNELILVVDDEPNQREIAVAILKYLGYRSAAVESGEAAVAYVRENEVDLLLLDMVMPKGMGGRETYAAVSRVRPGMPAVIASGYSETDDVRATQAMGAGALLKKPYSIEKLGQAVKAELSGDSASSSDPSSSP